MAKSRCLQVGCEVVALLATTVPQRHEKEAGSAQKGWYTDLSFADDIEAGPLHSQRSKSGFREQRTSTKKNATNVLGEAPNFIGQRAATVTKCRAHLTTRIRRALGHCATYEHKVTDWIPSRSRRVSNSGDKHAEETRARLTLPLKVSSWFAFIEHLTTAAAAN